MQTLKSLKTYVPSSSLRMIVMVLVENRAEPFDTDACKMMVSVSSAVESSIISRLNVWSSFPKIVYVKSPGAS